MKPLPLKKGTFNVSGSDEISERKSSVINENAVIPPNGLSKLNGKTVVAPEKKLSITLNSTKLSLCPRALLVQILRKRLTEVNQ